MLIKGLEENIMDMMTIIVLLFGAVVVLISIGVILNHVKNQKKETETVD